MTTDLSLSCREIREAAHLRRQIEYNVFKRMSHLCGTKRFYFEHQRPYFTMVRLFAAAVVAFDAFISMVRDDPRKYNRTYHARSKVHLEEFLQPTGGSITSTEYRENTDHNLITTGFLRFT